MSTAASKSLATVIDQSWLARTKSRIAVIQTSDNRSADHALLGKYRTWIKG
jgi:hypothetical protein